MITDNNRNVYFAINFVNAKPTAIQHHQQAKHNYIIGRKIGFFKHEKDIFFEISPPVSLS